MAWSILHYKHPVEQIWLFCLIVKQGGTFEPPNKMFFTFMAFYFKKCTNYLVHFQGQASTPPPPPFPHFPNSLSVCPFVKILDRHYSEKKAGSLGRCNDKCDSCYWQSLQSCCNGSCTKAYLESVTQIQVTVWNIGYFLRICVTSQSHDLPLNPCFTSHSIRLLWNTVEYSCRVNTSLCMYHKYFLFKCKQPQKL